jgi:hypothetical protein
VYSLLQIRMPRFLFRMLSPPSDGSPALVTWSWHAEYTYHNRLRYMRSIRRAPPNHLGLEKLLSNEGFCFWYICYYSTVFDMLYFKCFINTYTRMCPWRGCVFWIIAVQTRSLVVISKVGSVICPTCFRRDERENVLLRWSKLRIYPVGVSSFRQIFETRNSQI